MHTIAKYCLGAAVLVGVAAAAYAQGQSAAPNGMSTVTVNDPPGALPDPSHIPIVPNGKLVWEGSPAGEQHVALFGDPSKPGVYGQLIKWNPGTGSRTHMHDQDRFIWVISGSWWVSSSSHYDPKLTYPIPAGSYVEDIANTVHWDGARAGGPPVILELVGMGPVKTIQVGDDGKPLPRRQPAAAQ